MKLFPVGIYVSITDYFENLKLTKKYLSKNKSLFEAGFEFGNCFSRVDILVPFQTLFRIQSSIVHLIPEGIEVDRQQSQSKG